MTSISIPIRHLDSSIRWSGLAVEMRTKARADEMREERSAQALEAIAEACDSKFAERRRRDRRRELERVERVRFMGALEILRERGDAEGAGSLLDMMRARGWGVPALEEMGFPVEVESNIPKVAKERKR